MSWLTPHIATQIVDFGSAMLLVTCFAIVAQRRLSSCVDLFALQSLFLAMTAALVAFFTAMPAKPRNCLMCESAGSYSG